MAMTRLDKFISDNSVYTRSEVKKLIKCGLITVDEIKAKDGAMKIDSVTARVCVKGEAVEEKRNIYIVLNKPIGYVCSTDDPLSPCITKLLPKEILLRHKGIFPAGRLDKDSRGMVLLTDDGALSHEILSPSRHIPKYYLVKLHKPFEETYIQQFNQRIVLKDGTECLPARVSRLSCDEKSAFVELYEGKYHQIKRMFAAVENHVEFLVRVQMGGLRMHEKLDVGKHMEILHKDVEKLFIKPDFDEVMNECEQFFSAYLINGVE